MLLLASFNNDEPKDKEALGKLLFFDAILSKDNTISCASCHKPAFAFADTSAVSVGTGEAKGVRNTPSAMNVALQSVFFGMEERRTWKNRPWLQLKILSK